MRILVIYRKSIDHEKNDLYIVTKVCTIFSSCKLLTLSKIFQGTLYMRNTSATHPPTHTCTYILGLQQYIFIKIQDLFKERPEKFCLNFQNEESSLLYPYVLGLVSPFWIF